MRKIIGRKDYANCLIILDSIIYYIVDDYKYIKNQIVNNSNLIEIHPAIAENQNPNKGFSVSLDIKDIIYYNKYV